ncbi:hypothetical protein DXG01_005910 [Tephrocybe rancida]|nr:hypothetical protein DXG01_005910 [Tephrocybe rancida]
MLDGPTMSGPFASPSDLPHASLALALPGDPGLVSQGLRTLGLCIDSLASDFLNPTLSTVLMEALHGHLKPLPANHHPAHAPIRMLVKLGGLNRRLLAREPALKYHSHSGLVKTAIAVGAPREKIELGPNIGPACWTLLKGSMFDRGHSYTLLENCLTAMLSEDAFIQEMEAYLTV